MKIIKYLILNKPANQFKDFFHDVVDVARNKKEVKTIIKQMSDPKQARVYSFKEIKL